MSNTPIRIEQHLNHYFIRMNGLFGQFHILRILGQHPLPFFFFYWTFYCINTFFLELLELERSIGYSAGHLLLAVENFWICQVIHKNLKLQSIWSSLLKHKNENDEPYNCYSKCIETSPVEVLFAISICWMFKLYKYFNVQRDHSGGSFLLTSTHVEAPLPQLFWWVYNYTVLRYERHMVLNLHVTFPFIRPWLVSSFESHFLAFANNSFTA